MTTSTRGGAADSKRPTIADDSVDKNSEYYKRNLLPVDRGWAWMVCLGGFLTFLILGFANLSVVVLFVEIIDKYDTNITTASLIFMFGVFSVSFMSLLATNFIAPRIGERKVVFFAGIFFAVGSIGYSLAPNIIVFLCFAVVKGMAGGAVFVPGISLIRHYFHKRRSIAQIIANTGQSVAAIVAPPIIRAIRKEYGINGMFLILAAIELHLLVAGLLMRPVEAYKFRPKLGPMKRKGKQKNKSIKTDHNTENEEASIQLTTSVSEAQKEDEQDGKANGTPEGKKYDSSATNGHVEGIGATDRLLEVPGESSEPANGGEEDRERYTKSPHYASALSLVSEAAVVMTDDVEETSTEDKVVEKKGRCKQCGYEFFRLWAFRLVIIVTPAGAANLYMKNYIPTITKLQGATLDESALLQTIVGAVDLVSRLCLGLFADTHILKPSQILVIAQICLGVLSQFVGFFTTFETLVVMAVILGIFIGTRISLLALLTIEVVGVEMMPQAFSIIATVGTLSAASMNPILGAVAESSGNFVLVMHIVGVCFFISSGLLLLLPIMKRIDKKRKSAKKEIPRTDL